MTASALWPAMTLSMTCCCAGRNSAKPNRSRSSNFRSMANGLVGQDTKSYFLDRVFLPRGYAVNGHILRDFFFVPVPVVDVIRRGRLILVGPWNLSTCS